MSEPIVEVYVMRHLHSVANEKHIRDENPVLSEKGKKQAKHLRKEIKRLKIDHIVSSTSDRTLEPLIAKRLDIPFIALPIFCERRGPSCTLGKSNKDPEVRKIHDEILERYGPGYRHSDEEDFIESSMIVEEGLKFLLDLSEQGFKKILLKTHGLRARMYLDRAMRGALTPDGFRDAYRRVVFGNGDVMRLLYKPEFNNESVLNWQLAAGQANYLPPELRD